MSLATFGNDLYTGRRSIDFVGRLKRWMLISLAILLVVAAGVAIRGINLGIEFTGGSDFRVPGVSSTEGYADKARAVVEEKGRVPDASSTLIGSDTVRVQTERLDDRLAQDVAGGLAQAFGVPVGDVTSSVIGPSWGASVSQKALQALIIFLLLVTLLLAVYFRTWKMAAAALVALAHDIIITVGVYALAGFEVTPASMIGFLTILGYSLYDTVVVFDKVRENTTEAMATGRMTYSQAANLAVNQTLVRSINTSVVALLPVAVILVTGFTLIGPGTLLDLSLALFVGIAVGTYSSIFVATPLLAWLREKEPRMKALHDRVARSGRPTHIGPVAPAAADGAPEDSRAAESDGPAAADTGAAHPGGTAPDSEGEGDETGGGVDAGDPGGADDDDTARTATGRRIHPSLLADEDPPRSRRGRSGR